jgi:hypothetical protein
MKSTTLFFLQAVVMHSVLTEPLYKSHFGTKYSIWEMCRGPHVWGIVSIQLKHADRCNSESNAKDFTLMDSLSIVCSTSCTLNSLISTNFKFALLSFYAKYAIDGLSFFHILLLLSPLKWLRKFFLGLVLALHSFVHMNSCGVHCLDYMGVVILIELYLALLR